MCIGPGFFLPLTTITDCSEYRVHQTPTPTVLTRDGWAQRPRDPHTRGQSLDRLPAPESHRRHPPHPPRTDGHRPRLPPSSDHHHGLFRVQSPPDTDTPPSPPDPGRSGRVGQALRLPPFSGPSLATFGLSSLVCVYPPIRGAAAGLVKPSDCPPSLGLCSRRG